MKIFMILPYFPLPGTGTGNAIYGLSKGLLSQDGVDLIVLAEGLKYEESSYKEVPYIKFKKDRWRTPFSVSKGLKQYIQKEASNVDLIIINGVFTPYVYSLAMFAKKNGIPYVHAPHGVYTEIALTKSRLRKEIYFKLFEKKVIQNALAMQMFSETQLEDTKKRAFFKKGIVVPNGMDVKIIENKSNKKKIDEKVKIIFFGRKDVFTKGLDLLIKAVSQIEEKIELDIIGSDHFNTHEIHNLIQEQNIKNVNIKDKYLGDPIELLESYDFMAMPSRFEAFPMAVLEAMFAKLPILISKEVGTAEHVVKANAGVVCEANIESIKLAIEDMLVKKNEWEMMGENARNYIVENLTWKDIGNRTLLQYNNLLKEQPYAT